MIEEKVIADLTEAERESLLNALTKVHRAASELLSEPIDHGDSAIT
ncbi:hypothetical protein [Streptomyces sp. NPDC002172]